jgi:hypothetical protein
MTDPTGSGFTAEQLAAIRGEHTAAPGWLNPAVLPPAELVAKIDAAIERLEELGRHIYDIVLDQMRPLMAAYRAWVRDHPMPDEALDAIDGLSRYERFDQLMISIGQFVTYAHERLDDVPVYEAMNKVLMGDPNTVYGLAGDSWTRRKPDAIG